MIADSHDACFVNEVEEAFLKEVGDCGDFMGTLAKDKKKSAVEFDKLVGAKHALEHLGDTAGLKYLTNT